MTTLIIVNDHLFGDFLSDDADLLENKLGSFLNMIFSLQKFAFKAFYEWLIDKFTNIMVSCFIQLNFQSKLSNIGRFSLGLALNERLVTVRFRGHHCQFRRHVCACGVQRYDCGSVIALRDGGSGIICSAYPSWRLGLTQIVVIQGLECGQLMLLLLLSLLHMGTNFCPVLLDLEAAYDLSTIILFYTAFAWRESPTHYVTL